MARKIAVGSGVTLEYPVELRGRAV